MSSLCLDKSGDLWHFDTVHLPQDNIKREKAEKIVFGEDVQIAAVGAGLDHICALEKSGVPYIWGMNEFGQLGVAPSVLGHNAIPTALKMEHFMRTGNETFLCKSTQNLW